MIYIRENANAKINLFLEIYGKNEKGYHNIDTVMQSVTLCDTVNVGFEEYANETTGIENEIKITSDLPYIPTDGKNTAYKAAAIFSEKMGIKGKFHIDIKKRIPTAAGLGGGSADAAAVLSALNKLCHESLTENELLSMAGLVGADVPFCLKSKHSPAAVCKGIGDIFKDCTPLPCGTYIVIAKGSRGSNTERAYKAVDRIRNRNIIESGSRKTVASLEKGSLKDISDSLYNGFEKAIFPIDPEAAKIKRTMVVLGASGALLSGSGSAVFGLFDNKEKALSAEQILKSGNNETFFCLPASEENV